MTVVEDLHRARDAYARREWVAAYEGLASATDDALAADDFARLATAAYLLGHRNDCIQALQRAFQSSLADHDVAAAVRCAFWLAKVLFGGGEMAVGGGWVARAERLLDEHPSDLVERGYVLLLMTFQRISAGDLAVARELATQVEDYGRRYADADLVS
ncbi:MAG: helix-turn-helix transcriptional regulator, partial [Nocardioides sp.]